MTEDTRALTPAQKQALQITKLVEAVDGRQDMLVKLLGDTGISFDRFREIFRRAVIKGAQNPATNLLAADAGSVIQACIDACTAGLLPDGRQGAIVIFNQKVPGKQNEWAKKAQFMPMYEGMLAIAYASGNFRSIMAHVVYEGDEWDYGLGIDPWIKHKPKPRPARPNMTPYNIVAAYAVAKTKDGGVFVEVFEPEDIRRVMAVSRATSGPTKDWPDQMARKGPLRRLWKFLPRSPQMERVLDVDEPNYDLEAAPPPPAMVLSPGFSQLAHQPAEAINVAEEIPMEIIQDPVVESTETTEAPAPAAKAQEEAPPDRIQEFLKRIEGAAAWLTIKQALRGLLKAEDWDRGRMNEALAAAWHARAATPDKTDFVTDALLFCCWAAAMAPDQEALAGNLRVLEAQSDWARSSEEVQAIARSFLTA